MSFQMTSFEEILNYFKLINGWLNSKLCAKRKLLHSDVNACVFFVKKNCALLLRLFPEAIVELENSVFSNF